MSSRFSWICYVGVISAAVLVQAGPPKAGMRNNPYLRPQRVTLNDFRASRRPVPEFKKLNAIISQAETGGGIPRTDASCWRSKDTNPGSPLRAIANRIGVFKKSGKADAATQTGLSRLVVGQSGMERPDTAIMPQKPKTVLGKLGSVVGDTAKQAVAMGLGGAAAGGIASAIGGSSGNLVINLKDESSTAASNLTATDGENSKDLV